ncbi:MAG: hypothetical protein OQJ96_01370 [Flavobacteriales bacterium]|nr:hypothetical protein [Flavobacteriales bacterium]MCW8938177.1 hypothetical protein [Flavobacteriales bacterium]MCW8967031.1 hypothetical protein [Flavobacteriales bacterium]MCW8991525.1 hypothetical protein [Flavobacteriales bacterium]MCW9018918.1 hypothetical protein [Flavobacteriales bacterium]
MDKRIINIIGLLALLAAIVYIIKQISKKADTRLYSDEAYKKLQVDKNLENLDKAVVDYHEKGKWDNSLLNR